MITHKGMSMLLKHHGLDAESSNDDDIKNCINAAIKNDDEMMPEESEETEGEEHVENHAEDDDDDELEKLKAENADLKKKMKGKTAPVHVPNRAKTPSRNIESELETSPEDVKKASLIKNRASEYEKKGTPGATAWIIAAREVEQELEAGMHQE